MATEQRLDLIDRNAFAECLERMTKTAYPNLFPGLFLRIPIWMITTMPMQLVLYVAFVFIRKMLALDILK